MNLDLKYRPSTFSDLVCQDNVKRVLVNQIETGEYKQAYLFCGSAGCGKTTSARIFANDINEGKGKPIEIDGASNNGVDNVRNIIEDCRMKSLDSKYKVYIIDEVHMLSIGAFNALLKVLEEPPKGVIFILCTTDPQKIPLTIMSRLQRFDFKRIPVDDIFNRLKYIIEQENKEMIESNCGSKDAVNDIEWAIKEGIPVIEYDEDALLYIAKLADGGMRAAIKKLDTVLGYTSNITMQEVEDCLGIASYELMEDLLNAIYNNNAKLAVEMIDDLHYEGKDLKLFISDFTNHILDLCKFDLTQNLDLTAIPPTQLKPTTSLVNLVGSDFLVDMLDVFSKLTYKLKYEQNPKAIIESEMILLCR